MVPISKYIRSSKTLQIVLALCGYFVCSILIGIMFTTFLYILGYLSMRVLRLLQVKRIEDAITNMLPETLRALGQSLGAGYSLPQAFSYIAQESKPPLQSFYQNISKKLDLGKPLIDTLNEAKVTFSHPELHLVIDSLIIQFQIGGDITSLLLELAKLMREKIEMQNEVKSLTAQGRFSGIIVALLGPISLLLFYLLSPEYITIMFTHPVGKLMLIIAILLNILGFRSIWKITQIKI